MSNNPIARHRRYLEHKERMKTDHAYAEEFRAKRRVMERKKTAKRRAEKEAANPHNLPDWKLRKPGRITALCGWNGWG